MDKKQRARYEVLKQKLLANQRLTPEEDKEYNVLWTALTEPYLAAQRSVPVAQVEPVVGTPIIYKQVQRKVGEVPTLEVDAAAMWRNSRAHMTTAQAPEIEGAPGSALEYSRHHHAGGIRS